MQIRQAVTTDAQEIARVHVRGWRIGYADFLSPEFLSTLSVEESAMRWLRSLADITQIETYVAEEDGSILGWIGFGHNREGMGLETGEVHGLYVDPDHWDKGIGVALLAAAEEHLTGAGFLQAIVWTLAENTRARGLYEASGWTFDGTTMEHESGAGVVRYWRNLSSQPLPNS
jgi:GNAT superfamily N-acetyltransferase